MDSGTPLVGPEDARGAAPPAGGPVLATPDPGIESAAQAAAEAAVARVAGHEFETFRCGCIAPPGGGGRGPEAAAITARRAAIRAALRARLEAAWPHRSHRNEVADVTVDALPDGSGAVVRVQPLHVAGRYLKLARGISQTIFHCRLCRGRPGGCGRCAGTGRLFAESVEEFVRAPIRAAAQGASATFHGAGREDVDVLMLGSGRPFVVSVQRPRTRTPDLAAAAAEVERASGGRVLVRDLAVVTHGERRRRTTEHGVKTYRAVVEPAEGAAADAGYPDDAAARLAALSGAEVSQRTPHRVDARRADLVRRRRLLGAEAESVEPRRIVVVLRTDPGTYVKELVSGDGGRTEPSISGALGVPSVCTQLDVLGVDAGAGAAPTSGTS